MNRVLRFTFYSLLSLSLIMSSWTALAVWPFWYWYDVGILLVPDHVEGTDFDIRFSGGPKRSFLGTYSVIMRRASDNAIVHTPEGSPESGGGPFNYRPGTVRPENITISWWAGRGWAPFALVPPSTYFLETCWTVQSPFRGFVPDKSGCVRSNDFRVLPRGAE